MILNQLIMGNVESLFKEEDIQVLDYILDRLKDNKTVEADDLISGGMLPKTIKLSEAYKELERHAPAIIKYCGLYHKFNVAGGHFYSDERTVSFWDNGGFEIEYKRSKERREKDEERESLKMEIDRLTKLNLEKDNEAKDYQKMIRYQKSIIRYRDLIIAVLFIISLVLSIFLFFWK
ncbi:hypothetical protein M2459_001384 [Parabacteroides sp. PF5-5]|uniref:hypothetical protein n=1 Tax=unclassified Parabacteroides TaxID=2649774 RepID=UPI0024743635|nr:MULTISPECIES: hypothetical protein [unclassified Parabacteroides]MDH6304648.1 hypothetical protein [Parabacteroides sp. PH5-39]MDH6315738.1 hypothetical protein [Parabacteroides sp. PF5-13]MDH6319398.1 hypothetical protein [Parabacteroides sp. PH5-13]MDH6323129.1 hypothetical protein [Parabacteroides sp. PH5-8]MDH6326931.1 hypothetical protein [Parabacteroides sp. PH5-41]